MDIPTPVGVALVLLGVYLASRVAGLALKLAVAALVALGLYVWLV